MPTSPAPLRASRRCTEISYGRPVRNLPAFRRSGRLCPPAEKTDFTENHGEYVTSQGRTGTSAPTNLRENGRLQIGVLKAADADRKAAGGQEYESEKASEEHRQLAQLVGRFIAVAHVLQVGQHVLQRL